MHLWKPPNNEPFACRHWSLRLHCQSSCQVSFATPTARLLLREGLQVRGTVRKLDDPAKVQFLRTLPGAPERLELVAADLTEPNSLVTALRGATHVYHTASPVTFTSPNPQKEVTTLLLPRLYRSH